MKTSCLLTSFIALILSGSVAAAFSNGDDASGLTSDFGILAESSSISNADTIPARQMAEVAAHLDFGWNVTPYLMPEIFAQFAFVDQLVAPSTVANENMTGTRYAFGPGLQLSLGGFALMLGYDLNGSYTLSQQTASGSNSTYTNMSGFLAMLGYQVSSNWEILLVGNQSSYSTSVQGSSVDISGDKLTQTSYGVGLLYQLF